MKNAIGITGGIATGKSTLAQLLKQKGFQIINADQIARQVVLPQENGWQNIVKIFGDNILLPDQTLNRKKLGKLVFGNSQLLQQLNAGVQPVIRQVIIQKIKDVNDDGIPVFFEIPLLFEQNYQNLLQKTILVYTSPKTQRQRLRLRNNLSYKQARQRIKSQMSIERKRQLADIVVNNNGNLAYLKQQVNQLIPCLTKEEARL